MPKEKKKTSNILTVGEMIDYAFGHIDANVVNFKMLQTVLVLLARQLRLLNRQVAIEMESSIPTSGANMVVSEIKIRSISKKDGPRTSKSFYTTDKDKSRKAVEYSLIPKPSTRKFDIPQSTVWSSGGNSQEHLLDQPSSAKSDTAIGNEKYYKLLDKIEQQRERVLRVIHRRNNSRDEGLTTPSPMESMASTDAEFERLLIVENLPELGEKSRKGLPVVTRDLFDELAKKVEDLQNQTDFGSVYFPENMKLMQDLRDGASLTEAMAALQISARLDAAEKAIQRMGLLVPDANLKNDESASKSIYLTKDDFHAAMDMKQTEILGRVNTLIHRITASVEENTKQAQILENKLGDALNMKEKFEDMERKVISNTHQMTMVDTGLSSQMTNLQEQLTQVQLDLEAGLENMAETLTSKGVDTEVLTDLNRKFTTVQMNLERTGAVQRDLNDIQKRLASEIDRLKYDVELLRDIKSDRDEVEDALRDKAGLKDLNGMVNEEQFVNAYATLERDIQDAYATFKKQELTWQKALSDIFGHLDDKADRYMLNGLREDTAKSLNKLKRQTDTLKRIVGEPLAASISRRIYRDTACLSCANPAHLMPDGNVSGLPPLRPPGVGAETQTVKQKTKGDVSELPPCVPGLKIIHPIDQRAEICTRYCGGAHTKSRIATSIRPSNIRLEGKPLQKPVNDMLGSDGKTYQVEEELVPCLPCNQGYGDGYPNGIDVNRNVKSNYNSEKRNTSACLCCEEFLRPSPRHSFTPADTSACLCGEEFLRPSPRHSFTPAGPPMKNNISAMPSFSAPSMCLK